MKNILFTFILFASLSLFAQNNGAIKGKIVDVTMNNEPLLYANVALKNSNKEAQTNFHGNFEFNNLSEGKHTVIVSYPGYETIEIPVVVGNNKITRLTEGLNTKTLNLEDLYLANKEQTTIAFENTTNTKEGIK